MRPYRMLIGALAALLAAGCASRTIEVEIPPRVDLRSGTIGIVEFAGAPAGPLARATTQRFIAAVQAAQPGVRFIELGPADALLRALGRERIDPETIRIIGARHRVASVFAGTYAISDAKPRVSVDRDLAAARASAWVHVEMTARLWDTRDGATVWTRARDGDWPVARVRVEAGRPVALAVRNPEEQYGEFMRQLVHAVTEDFRPTYERRTVAD